MTQLESEIYRGDACQLIAYPLGGMGAGMVCLKGTGGLSQVSLSHRHDESKEPYAYSALHLKKSGVTLVLEGPVSRRDSMRKPHKSYTGLNDFTFGLPRFATASFTSRFPFGEIELLHPDVPLEVKLTGWSPFIPNDTTNSCLPAAALEYSLTNRSSEAIEAVFSFNAMNFMTTRGHGKGISRIRRADRDSLILEALKADKTEHREAQLYGAFGVTIDLPGTRVNPAWFRGCDHEACAMAWRDVAGGVLRDKEEPSDDCGLPVVGGTIGVELSIPPGGTATVPLLLSWYVPGSQVNHNYYDNVRECIQHVKPVGTARMYAPWYARRFGGVEEVIAYWRENYQTLRGKTAVFTAALCDNSLPREITEAVAANLCILKTPTVLREEGGRLWCREGCYGREPWGCYGTCTHVWNYAQALPHLFPELERTLRQTEFNEAQLPDGYQNFRHDLPIAPSEGPVLYAASDGQPGGLMKLYRDWRISGDDAWLREFWPKAKQSLDYCIRAWDPDHNGVFSEPHHNTYDVEFWGPDPLCSGFYLGALKAATLMGGHLGEDTSLYDSLCVKGRRYLETKLFNGEYFEQQIQWTGLRASATDMERDWTGKTTVSPEAKPLLEREGPRNQYGKGCLADAMAGAWMAEVCGVGDILDPAKVKSHLLAVHRYNLQRDFRGHAVSRRPGYVYRPGYAFAEDGGLVLCTWPRGGMPTLPFSYSGEVWSGVEYQVACHLMRVGCVPEGLDIVRTARARYDGACRNPFDEYECGHYYARSLSSYSLLQGITGVPLRRPWTKRFGSIRGSPGTSPPSSAPPAATARRG